MTCQFPTCESLKDPLTYARVISLFVPELTIYNVDKNPLGASRAVAFAAPKNFVVPESTTTVEEGKSPRASEKI